MTERDQTRDDASASCLDEDTALAYLAGGDGRDPGGVVAIGGERQPLDRGKRAVPQPCVGRRVRPKADGLSAKSFLEIRQGDWAKSVYWTGDTFPTPNVLDALKGFGSPDVFIPHLGGVGTSGPLGQISMGANHAADFVGKLRPGKVLPIHHSTYALYLEPVTGLPTALAGKTQGLDLVSEGTCVSYV